MKRIFLVVALAVALFLIGNQASIAATTNCVDTGNGVTYNYNGVNKSATNFCTGNQLTDYYCQSGSAFGSPITCPNGCDPALGICKPAVETITNPTTTPTTACSDTDDGIDLWKYGVVTDSFGTVNSDQCNAAGVFLYEAKCNFASSAAGGFEPISCKYGCSAGACKTGCSDSDGGVNYNQKGIVVLDVMDSNYLYYFPKKYFEDSCDGNVLKEYSCQAGSVISGEYSDRSGTLISEDKICPLGCEAGACRTTLGCTDSDGGKSYYAPGITTDAIGSSKDMCPNSLKLSEFYCNGDVKAFEQADCPNGCDFILGACKTITTPPPVTPTNPTTPVTPTTCTPAWTCGDFGACVGSQQTQVCTQSNCPSQDLTKTPSRSCVMPVICNDPDGHDYSKKETMTVAGTSFTDYCDYRYPKNVVEYFCNSIGKGDAEWGSCPNGCLNGACIPTPTTCTPNYTNCGAWSACGNGSKTQTCTQTNCPALSPTKTNTESCMTGTIACTDSDNGKSYFTKGYGTNTSGQKFNDTCVGNKLTEIYCDSVTGELMYDFKTCDYNIGAYKCEVDACIATCTPAWTCGDFGACAGGQKTQTCTQSNCPSQDLTTTRAQSCTTSTPTTTCSEDDNGEIYASKGTMTWGGKAYTDYCNTSNSNYLYEFYCDAIGIGRVRNNYKCSDGCLNGACRTLTPECIPNYSSCTDWSACNGGSKTQTCTQTNCPALSPTKTNTEICTSAVTCSENDGGKVFGVKGTTTDNTGSSTDSCYTNVLTEYYCDGNTKKYESYACDNGCYAGACASLACTDSDNGKNYWFKGYVNAGGVTTDDICTGSNTLFEYYCDGNTVKIDPKNCEYGCDNNGACKTNNATCFDSDGGLNAASKGFVIIGNTSNADTCVSANVLSEYACDTQGRLWKSDMSCNSDCVNGACTPATTCTPNYTNCGAWSACTSGAQTQTCTQTNCPALSPTKTNTKICTTTCTDSDQYCSNGACGSNNPLLKGILTYTDLDGKVEITEDVCMERDDFYKGKILTENFCQTVNGFATWTSEQKVCENGCLNGACKAVVAQSHTICQNQKCVTVNTAGTNVCTLGSDSTCSGGESNGLRCIDSDNGKKSSVKGEVEWINSSNQINYVVDKCSNGIIDVESGAWLHEYYCGERNLPNYDPVSCGGCGCKNGVCNSNSDGSCRAGATCTDSDGGIVFGTVGTVSYKAYISGKWVDKSIIDSCNGNTLTEYSCVGDSMTYEQKTCSGGCGNGACISGVVNSGGGSGICTPNYTNCGAWSACTGGQKTQTCTQSNCLSLSATKINTETCSTVTTTTPTSTCTDSDQGLKYYAPGYAMIGSTKSNDFCVGNWLAEQYCTSDGKASFSAYYCANGCAGSPGACKQASVAVCGDRFCNGLETCSTCPGDCGTCRVNYYCGDGACSNGETCSTCPSDCGACVSCGDRTCNGSETCSTCPGDCGACPSHTVCDTLKKCVSVSGAGASACTLGNDSICVKPSCSPCTNASCPTNENCYVSSNYGQECFLNNLSEVITSGTTWYKCSK